MTTAEAVAGPPRVRTSLIYSSLPLQGATRGQSLDVQRGETLALEQRNGKAGECTVEYKKLDDSTAQAGTWDPGATSANARKVANDDNAIALHRRVQLGRLGDLDPDHQRGGHPAGQPVEHGAGADEGRRPGRQGRAGEVLPDGRAHLRARRARRPHPGRGAGRVDGGGGRQEAVHARRQAGVRRGRRQDDRAMLPS